jgi:hypothetical protein
MDSEICFPSESLLFTIVQDSNQLVLSSARHVAHIVCPKEMVKQQHVRFPSILGSQRSLDINKARILPADVGHDIPNLAPIVHKSSSSPDPPCFSPPQDHHLQV